MGQERRRDIAKFEGSRVRVVDDVPALFLGGREEGADEREVHRAFRRAKAAGDFLPKLHHAPVAFGLIVGEGNRRIVKEAQRVLFGRCEAQEEIMSGLARRTAAPFAASLHRGSRQRHLGLMEGQPLGENGVVTTLTTFDQLRLHRNAPFSRSVRSVTGAAQQPLHLARTLLFLDLDESLQFTQMMGIAQGVQHPCIV